MLWFQQLQFKQILFSKIGLQISMKKLVSNSYASDYHYQQAKKQQKKLHKQLRNNKRNTRTVNLEVSCED